MDLIFEERLFSPGIFVHFTDTMNACSAVCADAQAALSSEALVAAFNGAFGWVSTHQDSDNPDREADGTRFMFYLN
jgi:hypothetical protein